MYIVLPDTFKCVIRGGEFGQSSKETRIYDTSMDQQHQKTTYIIGR